MAHCLQHTYLFISQTKHKPKRLNQKKKQESIADPKLHPRSIDVNPFVGLRSIAPKIPQLPKATPEITIVQPRRILAKAAPHFTAVGNLIALRHPVQPCLQTTTSQSSPILQAGTSQQGTLLHQRGRKILPKSTTAYLQPSSVHIMPTMMVPMNPVISPSTQSAQKATSRKRPVQCDPSKTKRQNKPKRNIKGK